jgi:hypothetical protein
MNGCDSDITRPDFGAIDRNLCIRAAYLAALLPDVFNFGVSAEDVVHEVWVEYFSSPNQLRWDPAKLSLEKFLGYVVLPRRMIDHIRRNRYGTSKFPISVDDEGFVDYGSRDRSLESLEFEDLLNNLMAEASGDGDIELFIRAALEITERGKVDQQMSEIMGKRPRNIVNIRKRFLRKLLAKGRLESWMKAISLTRTNSEKSMRRNSES